MISHHYAIICPSTLQWLMVRPSVPCRRQTWTYCLNKFSPPLAVWTTNMYGCYTVCMLITIVGVQLPCVISAQPNGSSEKTNRSIMSSPISRLMGCLYLLVNWCIICSWWRIACSISKSILWDGMYNPRTPWNTIVYCNIFPHMSSFHLPDDTDHTLRPIPNHDENQPANQTPCMKIFANNYGFRYGHSLVIQATTEMACVFIGALE